MKLICDLILHPDHGFPTEFFETILQLTKNINLVYEWREKLRLMFEIYKIKCFSIILNRVIKYFNLKSVSEEDYFISKAIVYLESINKKINNANKIFKLN